MSWRSAGVPGELCLTTPSDVFFYQDVQLILFTPFASSPSDVLDVLETPTFAVKAILFYNAILT